MPSHRSCPQSPRLDLDELMIKAERLRQEGIQLAQEHRDLADVNRVARNEARRIRAAFPLATIRQDAERNWREAQRILGQMRSPA
jgi:hypothetical protein